MVKTVTSTKETVIIYVIFIIKARGFKVSNECYIHSLCISFHFCVLFSIVS